MKSRRCCKRASSVPRRPPRIEPRAAHNQGRAMFHKVIVANRGAIASRLIRALREMKIRSVAVYSEADAGAPYLEQADEAHPIGPAMARDSYLNQQAFVELIKRTGADA